MAIHTTNTLTKVQIIIMSVTAGICVANVYYIQPILNTVAASIHIPGHSAGILAVLAQAGYGLGLFFLTPIGDKVDRKKLILWLQVLLAASLLVTGLSKNIYVLYLCSVLIGTFAVAAQVILPMAASIVTTDRGKIVGLIFTGILAGVLAARVFSGFITDLLGWHYVYLISAGMVTISAILMQADFPSTTDRFRGNYFELLHSAVYQFKRFSKLRTSAIIGGLMFGTLSSFWTTLTFHLSGAPFNYKATTIGLFGILAAASALLVPAFGKLADKGNVNRSLVITISMVLLSIVIQFIFPSSLPVLCLSVILLDIGVQATQVTNIAVIYGLDATANSRINTMYMTIYFLGGAGGAYAGVLSWNHFQWNGVLGQMLLLSLIAMAIVFLRRNKDKKQEALDGRELHNELAHN
ncbi:MFS transporter [Mucilaginibacter sp. RS28]|uniref:MFS transporter n=1 Tax=Mucilaginibacter straminoryzae TaxID=2932774 RepID=A0A9X1X058_9SPHI|nr:MFS transporter [Mucilaginibacter straminoryzae]MCJ8208361.1 MFS transporter [Mucilaginibacter straminoryzae]